MPGRLQLSTEQIGSLLGPQLSTDVTVKASPRYMHPLYCVSGALQLSTEQIGSLPGPQLPANVTGELDLTQALNGGLDNGTAATRGYNTNVGSGVPFFSNATQVSCLERSFSVKNVL